MRSFFPSLLGVAASVVACGGAASPSERSSSSLDGASATVLVHYPAGFGHRITLHCGGVGQDWGASLETTWTAGDVWRASLPIGASVQCKPLYDDQTWAIGPNWDLSPGQSLDMWPHFFHTSGAITQIQNWHSNTLNDDRTIWIYTPPSYDENGGERYPVVYMHDGQNLFYDEDSATGVSWNVGGAMDQGASDGTIHEAIVVGVDNDASRIAEYTPVADPQDGGGDGAAYLAFVTSELKPQIDLGYRTFADAGHTSMVGSSLGGLISLYAGLTRPDVYGGIGALSPSTWWDNNWVIGAVSAAGGALPQKVYLDSGNAGTDDDDVTLTAQLADAWRTHASVDLDYLVQDGASHSEVYWRQRIGGALGFLLGGR